MAPPTMPTGLSRSSRTGLSDAMNEAPSLESGVLTAFVRGTSLI